MKFKLVEYPYGREIGFNQDTVWFIQGTDDNKTWYNYIWSYMDGSPSIILEKERVSRTCPPMSAFLTNEEANEAFDKITNYYREQTKENKIRTLREIEI
jgi:hypothetical protein